MPDDREPKRRAQTSTERDIEGLKRLRNTPVHGVMALPDPIDDDHTPPPARLPDEADRERQDALKRIRGLEAAAEQNAKAIENSQPRIRDAEARGREMGEIQSKLGTIAHDASRWSEAATLVLSEMPSIRASVHATAAFVAVSKERDEAFRRDIADLHRDFGSLRASHAKTTTRVELLEQQTEAIVTNQGDFKRELRATQEHVRSLDTHVKVSNALTRREKAKVGGLGALAGALMSAISWLASHFFH